MVGDFGSYEDELGRFRGSADWLADRLLYPVRPDEAISIVTDLEARITQELFLDPINRLRFELPNETLRAHLANEAFRPNSVALLRSLSRTVAFSRTYLSGIPTLAFEGSGPPVHTIINVFDRPALEKIAFSARVSTFGVPDPADVDARELAIWLERALPDHPWARISKEADVVQDLGAGFSMFMARRALASATGHAATISYTVNTTGSGLTLDAFPELQYVPRRFGSTVSTPVVANLANGWWKFEAVVGGVLVRDRGRHEVSSTSMSTITSDL